VGSHSHPHHEQYRYIRIPDNAATHVNLLHNILCVSTLVSGLLAAP